MRPMDNWARKVENLADVPKIFRDAAAAEFDGKQPYALFAPAERWGWRKIHPKFLCLSRDAVSCLELDRSGVTKRTFPFGGVICVERGRILLHAWLKVSGSGEGAATAAMVEFNSVVEDLFHPIANTIRTAAAGIPPAGEEALREERRKLDFIVEASYKFANFAKLSLLPGEQVLEAVFAPEIRPRGFLGGLRLSIPAHLAVLTDREFILIEDEHHRGSGAAYGGIWRYVPLGKIEEFRLNGDGDGYLTLSARLAGGSYLDSRFSAASGEELQRLVEAYMRNRVS